MPYNFAADSFFC